jgi:tRNA(Arg) A34 adenosine deaminase TadA
MKRTIRISLTILTAILLGLLLLLLSTNLSTIRPTITIEQRHLDSLVALQDLADKQGEYPVSALVIYKDRIIGAGYNTFRMDNDPLGHAEINAFENVFTGMDYFEFRSLSRDSLVLISSYEPCPMCKGVINHLDIRKIYYMQPKKFRLRLKYLRKELSFNLKTRRIKAPEDQ